MKVIISGGREFRGGMEQIIKGVYDFEGSYGLVSEVVSGMCRGVDMLGVAYAKSLHIPVKEFPADWDNYGKAAGPIRNKEMADYAEGLIAFWDGKSRGTKDMIKQAKASGINSILVINY